MQEITASDFQLVSCQATLFTPDGDISVNKIIKELFPSFSNRFDGEPTVLPPVPEGAPLEIPRVIFESKSREWRCEFSPVRVNFFWRRTSTTDTSIDLVEFFHQAVDALVQYIEQLSPRVSRLAAVVTRFSPHKDPGLYLARHFCKEQWNEEPLNRPESFELHAHKRYKFPGGLEVNSWARCKTGKVSGNGNGKPIVLFEQDLNTLAVESKKIYFGEEKIRQFFSVVPSELDHILGLYYPSGSQ